MAHKKTLLLIGILSTFAQAFIPPVPLIVKDVMEGRRPQQLMELIFRHRIETSSGTAWDIEEHFIGNTTRGAVIWRSSQGLFSGALFDKKNYIFPGEKRIAQHSSVFSKYFLSASADELLSSLLQEQFVKRGQLEQYTDGFDASGDPQTWMIKEKYKHPDGVSLKRVNGAPAIAVVGGTAERSNSVYFDKAFVGIRRLEWKENGQVAAWNFELFGRFQVPGQYPQKMSFERGGNTLVTSEVTVVRAAKEKNLTDLKASLRGLSPPSGQSEEVLRLLLSQR